MANIPVLIELTMMSDERVSELLCPRKALSERRLITSGTSSSESEDWYNGLFFHVLSGGGGEEARPLDILLTGEVMIGAVILTSLRENLC